MSRNHTLRVFALILSFVFAASHLAAETGYVLTTAPGTNVSLVAARYHFTVLRSWNSDDHKVSLVSADTFLAADSITRIGSDPDVRSIEPDSKLRSSESDPASKSRARLESLTADLLSPATVSFYGSSVRSSYISQPAAGIIGIQTAQNGFGAGSGVVAVIDTGVDPDHPALRDVLLPGYDFTRSLPGTASELGDLEQSTVAILDQSNVVLLDSGSLPLVLNQSTVAILDQSAIQRVAPAVIPASFGHGTMVAGLVHLVAPGARILPLKAFRADGSAALSDVIRAIQFAADAGANIISMSFSFPDASPELRSVIKYAVGKGAICVAAAGNEGTEHKLYPAGFDNVIGVGSTNNSDRRSPFSNFGGGAKTSAPGEALITTYPGNHYAGVWGTSFSTALVSGALSMMRQLTPALSFGIVKDVLNAGPHIDQHMGDARLDLVRSLLFLSSITSRRN